MERLDRLEAKLDTLVNVVSLIAKKIDPQLSPTLQTSNQKQRAYQHEAKPTADHRKQDKATEQSGGSLLLILFIHEAWLLFQHANVLCNPYLQRLDRNYGISLREFSSPLLSMPRCLYSPTMLLKEKTKLPAPRYTKRVRRNFGWRRAALAQHWHAVQVTPGLPYTTHYTSQSRSVCTGSSLAFLVCTGAERPCPWRSQRAMCRPPPPS
jgi:hypothetical protein